MVGFSRVTEPVRNPKEKRLCPFCNEGEVKQDNTGFSRAWICTKCRSEVPYVDF